MKVSTVAPPVAAPRSSELPSFPQQSPIDIEDALFVDFGDRKLETGWAESLRGTVQTDDHGHGKTLVLTPQPEAHEIRLDRQSFQLESFHFHAPSEHWLDGRPHDMELHLVHRNPETGNLAVLGVLVDGDAPRGPEPDPLCKFLGDVQNAEAGSEVEFKPAMFLPEFPSRYYRYEGSLTTPPFTSNVSWVVMAEPLHVSQEELADLKDLFEKPARPPQPLHRRFVLASFPQNAAE